ncbi:AP-4 complex accessory subunit RUSC2 isoform X1 [Silurus meridionalis]|uniref:AP-4 complex accessory subunit RUSC2 isoform X1 n=1 Tax=Silurus meridionalis TaxID=175797 RepID=UPI001EE9AF39|nr:AP-4 complex accessory subunit RUSC2 isoform X1 [Silurus meridionalis]XP_046697897.1 AP-4 complex accessory subunit RUSC2 isoform X1 [Silurus meridionalis]KAI5101723.1 iporin isoform X1 [Silurus meridionalis]
MDSPPKLSGETLIVHHIPLVHCQVSGSHGRYGNPLRKSNNPFSCPENLGLIRTTSLPERDVLQREALVYSSLIQTSSSSDAFEDEGIGGGEGKGVRGGSMASDTSSFTSSNSEDALPKVLSKKVQNRPSSLRHNPFLLNDGEDDYHDDDDDDDGNNLNGYMEDSSFHLHGNSNSALDSVDLEPFHLHELGYDSGPFHLHESLERPWSFEQKGAPVRHFSSRLEGLDLLGLDVQHRHGSSGSTLSMDCGEQEWDDDDDDQSMRGGPGGSECCGCSRTYPESFTDFAHGYCSDSSCNSSDGVLVNFSTIYNKTNNIVPDKPINLNSSADHSCTSSASEPVCMGGAEYGSGGGAFYLDLHRSPTEAPQATTDRPSSSSCLCSSQPQGGTVELDANCNSYHNHEGLLPSETSANDLTSCMQSQARLVVATQNYYKLVTCDVSSHSSPSPAGSSVTSCSDEHSKGSPTQPTEYFLFRHIKEQEEEEEQGPKAQVNTQKPCEKTETSTSNSESTLSNVIEGQVYVNVSPPVGGASIGTRLRSRSYDRNLDKPPQPRLGSLERMLSCPVRLSEGTTPSPAPPPRVTSFAEIAKNKRKNGGSPSQKSSAEASSFHSHSSGEFSPIIEDLSSLISSPHWSTPLKASPGGAGRETRTTAEGGLSSSADSSPAVVRYSKDQRPTSLPIQPFTLQQQFGKPQPKAVLPLLDEYINHMQAHYGSAPSERDEEDSDDDGQRPRPSPLGSYSPPRSISCPAPLSHTPPGVAPTTKLAPLPPTPPPATRGHCFHRANLSTLPTLPSSGLMAQLEQGGQEVEVKVLPVCMAQRSHNAHHLSPQALKWREYRRKNPLGVEKKRDICSSSPSSSSSSFLSASAALSARRRTVRRNVFDFPPSNHVLNRLNGQSLRCYSDLLPDYFSQTERPPEEFCLSPDATTEDSISIDLHQKRGLVKAINTAVDLIVSHFGTSRDAGVKAKLGNSSVSPNVAHLILKYLCPAVCDVLQDGLRAYTLDIIIGQRRNRPWSVVEASTQLGPSTRVLHSLFLKVSHYSELTNHSMRLNAFILGLLNLQSLEFWFNHIYTHEDIIAAHYHPWGFLPLSQGACQPMFEELLLLLQPLSLLPFDLDLLFEPRQLQKGQEHLRRKEQLCSTRQALDQSSRSTLQLMRGQTASIQLKEEAASNEKGLELHRGEFVLRREETWPRMDGAESKNQLRRVKRNDRASSASESEGLVLHVGRMNGVGGEDEEKERRRERERERDGEKDRLKSKQAGWWFQLMQSSQVYIENSAEGSKFVKWEKRKKGSGTEGRRQSNPPPRVGVVEGAEASPPVVEEKTENVVCSTSRPNSSTGTFSQSEPPKAIKGKPSWMGSPPESVLSELKNTNETQPEVETHTTQNLRWGRLFGAGNVSKTEKTELRSSKNQKSRLPSGWLSLDRSMLDLVVQSVGKRAEPQAINTHSAETQRSQTQQQDQTHESSTHTTAACEVRALCHHIATETGHLSFHKGDVMRVLGRADSDWLLCALGDAQGLVPIIYVTLNDEESEDPRGPQ